MLAHTRSFSIYSSSLTLIHQSVPPERAVLNKERSSGSYRLSAYFFGKTLSEFPIQCILPTLYVIITYWMAGLNPGADRYANPKLNEFVSEFVFGLRFFIHLAMVLLSTFLGSSLGLLIGAVVFSTQKAVVLSSILILGLMLLGGFYVDPDNFPVWISWLQWVSFLKYSTYLVCFLY